MTTLRAIPMIILLLAIPPARGQDWPQLQGNPQRSGYTPDAVKPPFKLACKHDFPPERLAGSPSSPLALNGGAAEASAAAIRSAPL